MNTRDKMINWLAKFGSMRTLLMGLTLSVTPLLLAQATPTFRTLPGRCHMGICWDNQYRGKTLLYQGKGDRLYSVELAFRSWEMGAEPPNIFEAPRTIYAYCSTAKPALIFPEDSSNSDSGYIAHLLNPGGDDWAGYNMDDYPIYWLTCHNIVGPDFFSEEMSDRALQLGYPLNLPSESLTLDRWRDIIEE
ncbi:hypothetical protein [Roseofilum casamattae]|uniref:Uncharacterized protein n=1 Tax=Roseofilum casamattae BLCC-M143 TaxID=3022442 RepID=A0ABT7C249_9CYAN|nr:hypothetical protein [Roseofilum casamattae]MDJ1185538.1 hypothetical protein [Roseofilum casamattae BLCC-M143]